jgi:putative transposase
MSRKYKFHDEDGVYFISFATVGWIDAFTRKEYKDILIDSLEYCQKEKGLLLYGWVIMSNHVHLIASSKDDYYLQDIVRDFKKFTSKEIIKAIEKNPQESRKEWMLATFKKAGEYNTNNTNYQFWRQDNMPIELFTPKVTQQKLDYIHNNPVEAGIVEKPEDYRYSSAKVYAGEKGFLEVLMI